LTPSNICARLLLYLATHQFRNSTCIISESREGEIAPVSRADAACDSGKGVLGNGEQ
jgi:hypothetical protein